jgi:ABC-type multidrug transport system fused ATPase/permease subunit
MIFKILTKLLDTEQKTLEFILDPKSRVWQKLALILPISFWATALSIIAPLFVKFQVDAITGNWTSLGSIQLKDTFEVVIAICAGLFFLNLLNQVLWWIKNRVYEKVNFQAESFLEDKFNNYLTRFDSSFLGAENNLRLVRNLQWGLGSLQENFLRMFQLLIEIPVALIGLVVVLQFLHPSLMIIIVISTCTVMLIDAYKSQVWKQYELLETRASEQKNQLSWRVIWYFNNFLTNGWLHNLYQMYTVKRKNWQDLKLKQSYATNNIGLIISLLNEITNFATIILAAFLVITKVITIGTLSIFASYGDRVKDLITKMGDLFRLLIDMRFNLFRLSFLLNIKPKLDYSNIVEFKDTKINRIEFKNVDFTYPGFFEEEKDYLHRMQKRVGILDDDSSWWSKNIQKHISSWTRKNLENELKELDEMFDKTGANKQILKNLSFNLEKGQIYGMVGYNGAGKTTLTRLIKRTLDVQNGQILLNGTDIKTIEPLKVKDYISSLEQNSYLIDSLSVRENILLNASRQDINDEEISR